MVQNIASRRPKGASHLMDFIHRNQDQFLDLDVMSHKKVGKTNNFDRRTREWQRDFIGSDGVDQNEQQKHWFANGTGIETELNTYLNIVGGKVLSYCCCLMWVCSSCNLTSLFLFSFDLAGLSEELGVRPTQSFTALLQFSLRYARENITGALVMQTLENFANQLETYIHLKNIPEVSLGIGCVCLFLFSITMFF